MAPGGLASNRSRASRLLASHLTQFNTILFWESGNTTYAKNGGKCHGPPPWPLCLSLLRLAFEAATREAYGTPGGTLRSASTPPPRHAISSRSAAQRIWVRYAPLAAARSGPAPRRGSRGRWAWPRPGGRISGALPPGPRRGLGPGRRGGGPWRTLAGFQGRWPPCVCNGLRAATTAKRNGVGGFRRPSPVQLSSSHSLAA
jgi:hypothetical protein